MTNLGSLARMQGANAEYARRLLLAGPGNLETFTMQARTRSTRDAYALAISRGALDYQGLLARILYEAAHPPVDHATPTVGFDQRAFFSLARIMANQASGPQETYEAIQMYKLAIRNWRTKSLKRADRLLFLEALAALGHVKDVEKYSSLLNIQALDRNQVHLLAANARMVGGHSDSTAPSAEWMDLVNAGYRSSGIETISFSPGDGALFDRILCGPAEHITEGPKVTVLVPTFDSGPRIETALRSLTNQTWRNLEILVMDDASPDENDKFLLAWQERDERITVHKMADNGGTYRARNYAVSYLATGDFITVHDDDDWSHPRKIETQVRHLLDNPELVANMSLLSRATPDLVFTRINNNPVFTQPNYSSLMYRRDPVVKRIGFWDLVNRSADAEFHDRLKAEFDGAVGIAGVDVLSFLRVRSNSLTSGEISRGYIDRRRLWYQQSSREWHKRSRESGKSLHLAAFPEHERPFSAPTDMIGSKGADKSVDVDILYVTDFRFPGGNSSLAASELRLLIDQGYRIGMMHMTSPVLGAQAGIRDSFLDLARAPHVAVVSPLDRVRARLTLVRHPSVLQYPEPTRSGVQTEKLVVIVNHAPFTRDGLGSIYDLPQVARTAAVVFGQPASFAPESELIRDNMRGTLAPRAVLKSAWPGVVQLPPTSDRSEPAPRRVIGRHSRDQAHKWPETPGKLLASYPDSDHYEVRILGGADTPQKLLGETPANWIVHPFGSLDAREFLSELPFWVYQHHSALTESFGMAAAEAVASGCVVILPPYMEASFGKGAVYAEPHQVVDVIEGFISEPDKYYTQRARAVEYARANFSADAFYARVASLLPENG